MEPDLGFTPAWLASGVVTAESVADFARLAGARAGKPARFWRWTAFRDYVEERTPLSADACRAAYRLSEGEPDANLATAIACAVLYQKLCPTDVLREAAASSRAIVARIGSRRDRMPSPVAE